MRRSLARAALVVAMLPASSVAADESAPLPGAGLYRKYCAACHGTFADGKGPVAPYLAVPPTDLTRLEERYGSPLPYDEIAARIDGRREIRGHGLREMPVWGERLYEDFVPAPGVEAAKSATIQAILQYLETIQGTAVGMLPH